MKTIERIVIEELEPTFKDAMHSMYGINYWVVYSETLYSLLAGNFDGGFIKELNMGINETCSKGVKDACIDVASTLESLAPEKYAGKFHY